MKVLPYLLMLLFFFSAPLVLAQTPSKQVMLKETTYTKKTLLKAKLKTFKNTVKAERINRINAILETMNTTKTEIYTKHLATLQTIITQLEQKISQAEVLKKDTKAAKMALENAKIALQTAQTTVTEQQQKEYIVTVSSENTVKNNILLLRNTVYSDLEATQASVANAKQATLTAMNETKILFGVTDNE